MPQGSTLGDDVLATWRTNNRVTMFLFENLPEEVWPEKVPGAPRRTVRMLAGHIHNTRRMWIKSLGKECGVKPPQSVNRHEVTRDELLPALQQSGEAVLRLLAAALEHGGEIPGKKSWVNFPLDAVHFLCYLSSHEAHHRGQILMIARQTGHRLPQEVSAGVWLWSKRLREAQPPTAR